jgi:preprotein translocase subunit SecF
MAFHFRYLIPPGTRLDFMGKRRPILVAALAVAALSLLALPLNVAVRGSALNWSTDFTGGTEVTLGLRTPVDAAALRGALASAGFAQTDLYAIELSGRAPGTAFIVRMRTARAVTDEEARRALDVFFARFGGPDSLRAAWSGDSLLVRSARPLAEAELAAAIREAGLEMKPWTEEQRADLARTATSRLDREYRVEVPRLEQHLADALGAALGAPVTVLQVDSVGAKAGADLRNGAIKALLYAIAAIMLYIAFRFDVRYAPATVVSLVYSAVVTVGVLAVSWTEVSLVTVAAVLTVVGYSMNDTVVVFDRVRENEHKLKDKKLDAVVNISINEVLSRTVLNSITAFMVTLTMTLLGKGDVRNFGFTMSTGIVVGTFASIVTAAPVLLLWRAHGARRGAPAPAAP